MKKGSFLRIFYPIFVLFSLYLLGDAFYRWDGFLYYGGISEFLPSVAFEFIFLTGVAVCASILLLIITWQLSLFFKNIKTEDVLIFLIISAAIAFSLYYGKKMTLRNMGLPLIVKYSLLLIMTLFAFCLTRMLRHKSERLVDALHERIRPLIWLFGTCLIFSPLIITYKVWKTEFPQWTKQLVSAGNNGHNIILVTFDALTAENMSVYGYRRPTTPFMEKWAKSAALFSKVEAGSNYTSPTLAGLMTGKRTWTNQTYSVFAPSTYNIRRHNENLPFLLKEYGYSTVALTQTAQSSAIRLGISGGFDIKVSKDQISDSKTLYQFIDKYLYKVFADKIIWYDWAFKDDTILFKLLKIISSDSVVTSLRPEIAFEKFLELFDNGLQEPYFAWIHLFAPHDPYLPPDPYKGLFNPSGHLRTWTSQMRPDELGKINIYRDRYDEFITYADKEFDNFIKQLEKRNIMKNTVILLSADHGESFDHNFMRHGGPHLYEQLTHIPLIIKVPGQVKGHIIDDLVEQVDITPTILELAGIPEPSWMEGRSFAPLLRGDKLLPKQAFSVASESFRQGHEIKSGTFAVWEGDYKLIHYLDANKSLLFNLKRDPEEINDLFDTEPVIGSRLLNMIKENLQAANEKIRESDL